MMLREKLRGALRPRTGRKACFEEAEGEKWKRVLGQWSGRGVHMQWCGEDGGKQCSGLAESGGWGR